MLQHSSHLSETASTRRPTLRRVVAALAVLGAVLLWLWALPALVQRDGFTVTRGDTCTQASFRDPVTGRSAPPPSIRITAPDPCHSSSTAVRP